MNNEKQGGKISPCLEAKIKDPAVLALLPGLPQGVLSVLEQPETVEVFGVPEYGTSRSKFFRFHGKEGLDVKTTKQIVVIVPGGEQMHLQDVFLGHRRKLRPGEKWNYKMWDDNGAYTDVLVFDGNTGQWREWHDPHGHKMPKFAEPRDSIEYEKLSDYFGMVGDIKPIAFLLISKGKGDPKLNTVTEHSLEVFSHPEMHEGMEEMSAIYSPGTAFVDFKNPGGPSRLPRYGGGKEHHVKGPKQVAGGPPGYPMSIPLRGKTGHEPFKMTEKLKGQHEFLDENNRIIIKLPAGKRILSLEIAAGAGWWPIGQLPHPALASAGGRKISAYLTDAKGKPFDHFMKSLNVGPQGVLLDGPTDPGYITKPGDQIIIEGEKHTSYVMGWRILYDDAKTPIAKMADKTHNKALEAAEPELDLVSLEQNAGGTQGAKWYLDKKSGDRFIGKTYEHAGPEKKDRCATEYISNRIYNLMGVAAPESHIYKGMVVSREIKQVKSFPYDYSQSKGDNQKAAVKYFSGKDDIRDGFIVDAWLANWDVFGLEYDNILVANGRAHRADSGGTLFYRAMGNKKPQFANEGVSEINTMRDPSMAKEAGVIFKDQVTDDDVRKQVEKLVQVMTDFAIHKIVHESGISNPEQIMQALIKRRDWLAKTYLKEQTPKTADVQEQATVIPAAAVKKTAESPSKSELQLVSDNKKVGLHGVMHVDKKTGKHFIVKEYSGNVDRCATEYIANRIYKEMEIPVIDSRLSGGRFVSRATQGLTTMDAKQTDPMSFFNHPDVLNGFVVDAWLANWDVFGLNYEQIRKNNEGRMLRTSNNGSLFFRAMGAPRPAFNSPEVTEVVTMRNPVTAPQAGKIFGKFVSDKMISEQVKLLVNKMKDNVIKLIVEESGITNAGEVIKSLIKRRDWLAQKFLHG